VTKHAAGFDPAPDKEMKFGYGSYDRLTTPPARIAAKAIDGALIAKAQANFTG
jgi:hypothetical protein